MRTTAPSPAALSDSKTGLSLNTVQLNEPVRSPSSRLKNELPFEAVFAASFLMTSRLVKARPCEPTSSDLRSRTINRGISSGMRRGIESEAADGRFRPGGRAKKFGGKWETSERAQLST